jgi:hypothetical protein
VSLFGKKQPEVPQTFIVNEAAEASGVDHNNVLDYLLQLKTEEYEKLLKLAGIYREANKAAGELIPQYDPDLAETVEVQQMGKAEPIMVSTGNVDEDAIDDFLNDELENAFIEDEPKKGTAGNASKTK